MYQLCFYSKAQVDHVKVIVKVSFRESCWITKVEISYIIFWISSRI